MHVVHELSGLRARRRALTGSLGLVPTMGSLHEGHLALVRRARAENDHVVVSIFVNPKQFDSPTDLARYPRNLERDLELLQPEGVDLVLAPPATAMYPVGFATHVEVAGLGARLEGQARTGHFRGVATVVAKLFNLVQPDRAYFGQKDAQQVRVIEQMVTDLAIPVEIVVVPTVRDPDGVALSSRNARLTAAERRAAAAIPAALHTGRQLFLTQERNANRIRQAVLERLAREPLIDVEYVSVAHPVTLEELTIIDEAALLSLAVVIGDTRLIDNLLLNRGWSHDDQVSDMAAPARRGRCADGWHGHTPS